MIIAFNLFEIKQEPTPASLPQAHSIDVTDDIFFAALQTVEILDKAKLNFNDVTE
tara:strand:+ start:552 stop:716 length:165 start_codon:yes stop_codon:yes gene_type:complete